MRYNNTKSGGADLIQLIFGEKGSGKTKKILEIANQAAEQAKGSVVFIDEDERYMFDLNCTFYQRYGVRLIRSEDVLRVSLRDRGVGS